jgi:hypothetical protein
LNAFISARVLKWTGFVDLDVVFVGFGLVNHHINSATQKYSRITCVYFLTDNHPTVIYMKYIYRTNTAMTLAARPQNEFSSNRIVRGLLWSLPPNTLAQYVPLVCRRHKFDPCCMSIAEAYAEVAHKMSFLVSSKAHYTARSVPVVSNPLVNTPCTL